MLKLSFDGETIEVVNASIFAYVASVAMVAGTKEEIPAVIAAPPAPPAPPAETSAPPAPPATAGTETKTDAAGVPFDAERHTGSIVKSGLWRLKAGKARGPGEGEDSPNYIAPEGYAPPKAKEAPAAPVSAPPAPPAPPAAPVVDPNRPVDPAFRHDNGDGTEQWYVDGAWDAGKHEIPHVPNAETAVALDEADEFAAFRAAAVTPEVTPAAGRTWTDADLSSLCNQAAVASGAPENVKVIITKYVGNEVAHSRNIPADQREAFAQEIEAAFGLTYAG